MSFLVHDTSEIDRLDAAFAAKRHAEAYATRAAARGTLIRRVGVASLLAGLGIGAALFGASFLIAPKERLAMFPGEETVRGVFEPRRPAPDIGPYAAKTPDEDKFVEQPRYQTAKYHGRIVKSVDGRSLSFQDGQNFSPGHWDFRIQKSVGDPDKAFDSAPWGRGVGFRQLRTCRRTRSGQLCAVPVGLPGGNDSS